METQPDAEQLYHEVGLLRVKRLSSFCQLTVRGPTDKGSCAKARDHACLLTSTSLFERAVLLARALRFPIVYYSLVIKMRLVQDRTDGAAVLSRCPCRIPSHRWVFCPWDGSDESSRAIGLSVSRAVRLTNYSQLRQYK